EGFKRKGITVTSAQAREPMGMSKWDHIKTLGQMPAIAAQWQEGHGRSFSDADVDEMYEAFVPVLLDILPEFAKMIPGCVETAVFLQEQGIKVAGTTGYFEEAMDICVQEAAKQGYKPDNTLCATQVSAGRPAPWLIYNVMNQLNVFPPSAVVKVGDTKPDIQAGLNAGVWTIGVAKTGNEVGLPLEAFEKLPQEEQEARTTKARETLTKEGAHYVIDSVSELPAILALIERKLAS
ncbi:MAG: phosphonoacetaldehyde hydrolase, partial [Chloroflexota bacterium]